MNAFELLQKLSQTTSQHLGNDFLLSLCQQLTSALGMQFALIAECVESDNTRVRTVCLVNGQQILDNVEYDATGHPCEVILQGKEIAVAEKAYLQFSKSPGTESVIGLPIRSSKDGKIIGHMLVSHSEPLSHLEDQLAVLSIFANRVAAEMERMKAESALALVNAELRSKIGEVEALKHQLELENSYLQEEIRLDHNFQEIVSKSSVFRKVLQQVQKVASTDSTVLIQGETGTGKELIARAVHNNSRRSNRPLVKVNCAALPAHLIESELFGHEKGAFTGAIERKIGRFELADGGSIFLDEIGELPMELQSKLLRVLQEGEFERLGNPKTIRVNVRVIAATNRPLQHAVERQEFREDLYYRLNVFPIDCPPLRDRKEDIIPLINHFCRKHEARIGKKVERIATRAVKALEAYYWPGNVRELENIIERAMILSTNGVLDIGDWIPSKSKNTRSGKTQTLEELEREYIVSVLEQTGWKVSGEKGAARILGLNATTLEARMKKWGIRRKLS